MATTPFPPAGAGMTPAEARKRIPGARPPIFWVGDAARLERVLARVRQGTVRHLCRTPGNRPMISVEYGTREPVEHRANYNSAVGGRDPEAFADRGRREKPVVLLVGPVHGQETEALAGLANLMYVLETGSDLEGRPHAELREKAAKCRLLIVPVGNPDGMARFEPGALVGMRRDDVRFWGQGTYADNTFCGWPECKRTHPMKGGAFLGCYFNDDGINPMHDDFFDPMGPEAPAILKLAKEEAPDIAVSLHSHAGAPTVLRTAYAPLEVQQDAFGLGERLNRLLALRGLPQGSPRAASAEQGAIPSPFNLTSALYHICGCLAFTFECPHGLSDPDACVVDYRQIVDIQLALYEAMIDHSLESRAAGCVAH